MRSKHKEKTTHCELCATEGYAESKHFLQFFHSFYYPRALFQYEKFLLKTLDNT